MLELGTTEYNGAEKKEKEKETERKKEIHTDSGSIEFWISGRRSLWYLIESLLSAFISDESRVKIACFMRCSSPDCSQSGGRSDIISSEKGSI